jgi:uncharacterized membrane protein YfcA
MDWTVYWFMLPVCVVVASTAMFSGISGAALLMPVFLLAFPLLGVPPLSAVAAVGMSLFLEVSGFGTGVYRYLARGLVDTRTARTLVVVTVPAAVLGALVARWMPGQALRLIYGVAMLAVSSVMARHVMTPALRPAGARPFTAAGSGPPPAGPERPCRDVGAIRTVRTADGAVYRYCADGLPGQRVLSGLGAVFAGLVSTGVGEATLPALTGRSRFPVPVAAATSTVVVASTVVGAALTHLVQMTRDGGLAAIPWNLLVWAVPGAIVGAFIGTALQGRVPARAAQAFFAGLFALIGVVFVAVFGFGDGAALLA